MTGGDLLDPGGRGHLFDGLDPSPAALCGVLHGVMIHDHFGAVCYPAVPPGFADASRVTVPVAVRLEQIDRGGAGLAQRPPEQRIVGTCRDFAQMFCAMARHHGLEARLRCGFAAYLDPPGWEDHWVAEYRGAEAETWARADAQIDGAHMDHLKVGFDPARLPAGAFLTGCEAWAALRRGEATAETFGHGSARGAWFVKVNLMRDLLCRQGRPVSDWDRWREVAPDDLHRALPDALCDRLAEAPHDIPAPPLGGRAG